MVWLVLATVWISATLLLLSLAAAAARGDRQLAACRRSRVRSRILLPPGARQ